MKNLLVNRQPLLHRISNHALVAFSALLVGASTTSLRAATFSDDNWIRMSGHPGVNDEVRATAVDASGNLYVAGAFTVAGDVFVNGIAKWDGTRWSALGSGLNGGVWALAVSGDDLYAAGDFTTAGGIPANNIAKWNGTQWSALGSGVTGDSYGPEVRSLAVSGNDVYVSGYCTNAGGVEVKNIAKWNGSSWSALGSGLSSPAGSLAVLGGDLYAGGSFTNAGGIPVNRIAKWNGSSWSAVGSGVEGPYANVSALAVSGNDLYVAGYFSTAGGIAATNMAKWNGSSWSVFPWPFHDADGQVLQAGVWDLAVSGNDLYASGTADTDISSSGYYGYVVKWNGSSWSRLGARIDGSLYDAWDPVVSTVSVVGTNVYAGGAFTVVGNRWVSCLIKWNGSDWSNVTSSPEPTTVSVMVGSGDDVYAGVSIQRTDGIVANYVGRWNGSSWSPLGSGNIYNVTALAVSGREVYAAGNFTEVGITGNVAVARWNGSNWSAVGSGMGRTDGATASVKALAVLNGELYAGGYFTTAGGVAATNIARWNGTHWVNLGWVATSFYYVNALAVSGSNLYAGGGFSAFTGGPGNSVARWNGSSWSALGSGLGNVVQALAVMGGDLYAAGDFAMADDLFVRVSKWDGTNWSAVGPGMTRDDWSADGEHNSTPHVFALAVAGHDLYAGGFFNTAGETDANYIAKWDGTSWSALGSGMDYGVRLLAASGDELFVAGDFTTAGRKLGPGLARARIGSRVQTVTASNSSATIRFSGVTGYPYEVQRATNLTPPVAWTIVSEIPLYPAADGSFAFTDTNAPPGTAFYRTSLLVPAP